MLVNKRNQQKAQEAKAKLQNVLNRYVIISKHKLVTHEMNATLQVSVIGERGRSVRPTFKHPNHPSANSDMDMYKPLL